MSTSLVIGKFSESRKERVYSEFLHALNEVDSEDLKLWSINLIATLKHVSFRRVKGFVSSAVNMAKFTSKEFTSLYEAIREKRAIDHVQVRATLAKETVVGATTAAKAYFANLTSLLKKDPKEAARTLFVGTVGMLGFGLGSGGLDGDGGVPDLDFLGGIGRHRSIFTHSIISGIVLETIVISVVSLMIILHRHLPVEHDPLWDDVIKNTQDIGLAFTIGASAGIAYHMAIDATIDGGGTYKDLPFSLSQDGHQFIMGVNAMTEGIDVGRKGEFFKIDDFKLFPE